LSDNHNKHSQRIQRLRI